MTIGWPSGTIDQAPVPTNLLPGRIEGWPAGTQRAANEAERILSTAVAWWDPTVSGFRDGDRWLRNSGTAGGLLDLRLGSSVVANTNDPLYLAPDATGYVYLPGVTGNAMSVPDEAALDIAGDIDIRVQLSANWSSAFRQLVTKQDTIGGSDLSFRLQTSNVTAGRLSLLWSANGSSTVQTETNVQSTAGIGVPDDAVKWVRATLDVDNGNNQHEVKYFTSDNGVTWTQLGDTRTFAGTTSIFSSASSVRIGSRATGNGDNVTGRAYRAQVLNGIDGTTVLDVDCDAITSGSATSFTATTGQTVTINRSTSGRKSVAVPARRLGGRPCFLLGTDDYFEVPADRVWQHQLLNFGQGDSFTVLAVVRQPSFSATQVLLAKRAGLTGASAGYSLRNGTGTPAQGVYEFGDGFVNQGATPVTSRTAGALTVVAASITTAIATAFTNGTTGAGSSRVSMLSLSNFEAFRIGRLSGSGTNYADMEFTAAAIFRRALTAAEIATITTYYSGG